MLKRGLGSVLEVGARAWEWAYARALQRVVSLAPRAYASPSRPLHLFFGHFPALVWLNISPRPLFHITSIYFESKSGRRQSAVFVTVEGAMTIIWLQSVVATECSIRDCRRRYDDRLTGTCNSIKNENTESNGGLAYGAACCAAPRARTSRAVEMDAYSTMQPQQPCTYTTAHVVWGSGWRVGAVCGGMC